MWPGQCSFLQALMYHIYGVYHCIDLNSSLLINNDTKRRLIAKWQHNWFHKSKPANHMIPVRIVGGGRYCW